MKCECGRMVGNVGDRICCAASAAVRELRTRGKENAMHYIKFIETFWGPERAAAVREKARALAKESAGAVHE